MEIIVKKGPQRSDPKTPQTHPDYERALAAGARNWPHMKFSDEGEREQYIKNVKSNPNNVLGLPVLYPPLEIKSYSTSDGMFRWNETPEQECLRHFLEMVNSRKLDLYCYRCERITSHFQNDGNWHCPDCGSKNSLKRTE